MFLQELTLVGQLKITPNNSNCTFPILLTTRAARKRQRENLRRFCWDTFLHQRMQVSLIKPKCRAFFNWQTNIILKTKQFVAYFLIFIQIDKILLVLYYIKIDFRQIDGFIPKISAQAPCLSP